MRGVWLLPVALMAALALPLSAGPMNVGPPVGPILDLAGQTLQTGNNDWTQYTVTFVADHILTDITFAFRNDPGYTGFDDASVVDTTAGGSNEFVNGGFETGDLTGWNYDNVYGASFGGYVANAGCTGITPFPHGGSDGWCDGATQAYDAIDQAVATVIGDTYTISFWTTQFDTQGVAESVYQQLSTNGDVLDTGGNGVDTLVYEGPGIPAGAPEPGTIMLVGSVLAGVGLLRRRK